MVSVEQHLRWYGNEHRGKVSRQKCPEDDTLGTFRPDQEAATGRGRSYTLDSLDHHDSKYMPSMAEKTEGARPPESTVDLLAVPSSIHHVNLTGNERGFVTKKEANYVSILSWSANAIQSNVRVVVSLSDGTCVRGDQS